MLYWGMDQILQNAIEGLDDMINDLAGLKEVSGGEHQSAGILGGLGLAVSEASQQQESSRGLF